MSRKARTLVLALVVIFVLATLTVLFMLVGRTPQPPPLPNPNGYDDFLKAAGLLTGDVGNASALDHEPTLFHLINLAREQGAFLLFTARTVPTLWPVSLPDLVSRLRALPAVALDAPDDALLRGVLVKLAADRQLNLDDSVVRYLLTHVERSFAAVRGAVIALDKEALRQGRPPSRALAAELFRDGAES